MADLVLYDGVCGLCNRLTQFILKRDRRDHFRFAALQSSFAIELLQHNACSAKELNTVYVIVGYGQPGERLLTKGRAMLHILGNLGGIWVTMKIFNVLPSCILNATYDFIATRRYLWFGQSATCIMPAPEYQSKFLDTKER